MGTPVKRDNARLVDEFLQNDHVALTLKNLIVAAVPTTNPVPPA
jgi:hypothetical protein